jgi:hypothetical protein
MEFVAGEYCIAVVADGINTKVEHMWEVHEIKMHEQNESAGLC